MLKKIGISLMAALMMSSVALACDSSLSYDEYLECCFTIVDKEVNIQEGKQEERKMIKFDKAVVEKRMMEDGLEDCGELSLHSMFFIRVKSYDPRMQNILDCYLANGTISDEVIDGISLKKIIEIYNNGFWDGINMMDIYLKTPNGAEELNSLSPLNPPVRRFPITDKQ